MKEIQISVIVPALNEEESILATIENILSAFQKFRLEGEIIVINDGSQDQTLKLVLEKMKDIPNLRLINHQTPQGIGVSFWDGLKVAKGKAIVMIPGDNENDASEILRYYFLLRHVDAVVPFVVNKNVRTLFRNFLSFLFTVIVNFTFLTSFHYTNGTVLYKREIVEKINLKSKGFFFQTEILVKLAKQKCLFAQVPYYLGRRKVGKSKAITLLSLWQVLKDYFKVIFDIYFLKTWKN